jgi:hypothetical protein
MIEIERRMEDMALGFSERLTAMWNPTIVRGFISEDGKGDIFNHRLSWAFPLPLAMAPDEDLWVKGDICKYVLNRMVEELKRYDMIQIPHHPFKPSDDELWVSGTAFDGIPVYVKWKKVKKELFVNLDLPVFRYTGHYHRMIINGPLHRLQMPFKEVPKEGEEFDFLFSDHNWESSKYNKEGYTDFDAPLLPVLAKWAITPHSLHRYVVEGDYCYYLGEKISR